MSDGKCPKRYSRDLLAETITDNHGYPLYRRQSTEDGGKSIKLKVHNNTIDVDNRWVVPYSPLLLKTNDTFARTLLYSEVPNYLRGIHQQENFSVVNKVEQYKST
ncbi:helitron_like_N domain-containing protein [Trichonephila clavipes]|nr:helitron_like_N domain-containing protein [Trichonephila clavipes]